MIYFWLERWMVRAGRTGIFPNTILSKMFYELRMIVSMLHQNCLNGLGVFMRFDEIVINYSNRESYFPQICSALGFLLVSFGYWKWIPRSKFVGAPLYPMSSSVASCILWPRGPARVVYPVTPCIISAGWRPRSKLVRGFVYLWLRGPARAPYPVVPCILSAGWRIRSKFVRGRPAPSSSVAVSYQLHGGPAPSLSVAACFLWPRVHARVPYPVAPCILPAGWWTRSKLVRCPMYPMAPPVCSITWPCILSAGWRTRSKFVLGLMYSMAPWPRPCTLPRGPVYPISWMENRSKFVAPWVRGPARISCSVASWIYGPVARDCARVPYSVAMCIQSAGWRIRSKFVRGPMYPMARWPRPCILSRGLVYFISWTEDSLQVLYPVAPWPRPCTLSRGFGYLSAGSVVVRA